MITSTVLKRNSGKTYNPAVGALLTELAENSYEKPDYGGYKGTLTRYKGLGFPYIFKIENKKYDTQLYIVSNDTDIVVAWRGSESPIDWKNNFNFWPKRAKDIKTDEDLEKVASTETKCGTVHQGFYLAMGCVFDEIRDYVVHIDNYRTKRLWTCGHSLGGADATLFFRFFDEIAPFEAGYGLSAPMVGQITFKKGFNKMARGRFYVVINDGDIVSHMPPQPLYQRVGKFIYIDVNGNVREKTSFLFREIDKIRGHIRAPFSKKHGIIDTHHPAYIYNAQAKAAGDDRRLQIWEEYRK